MPRKHKKKKYKITNKTEKPKVNRGGRERDTLIREKAEQVDRIQKWTTSTRITAFDLEHQNQQR